MSHVFDQDDIRVEAEGTVDLPVDLADRYVQLRSLALALLDSDRMHPEHDCAPYNDLVAWLEANS